VSDNPVVAAAGVETTPFRGPRCARREIVL